MTIDPISTLNRPVSLSFTKIADLTHTLSASTPYYHIEGVTSPFKVEPLTTIEAQGVYTTRWSGYDHHGTNINSPNHFVSGGLAAHELDPRTFFAPLVIIDISARAASNPVTALTVQDLLDWEGRNGKIPQGTAVFQRADWDQYANDLMAHLNRDENGMRRNPGISAEAARFLTTERDIVGVGTETVAIDHGPDSTFETHRIIHGAGKWAIENLTNLKSVPEAGATLILGPSKVKNASGGMTRVMAVW